MKVYIQTDIEGVAGVVHFENRANQTAEGAAHRRRMQQLLTDEVKAAIQGALDAGAEEVVVNDSHGSGYNILFEQLSGPVRIIHGRLDRQPFWLPLLDETFDALVGVGMHPRAGTAHGILPHTDWDVNGTHLSEMGMACALAGTYGVAAVFCSGDQAVCDQVRQLVPQIETAAVKQAFSPYTAVSHLPETARKMIYDGVLKGLQRRSEIEPLRLPGPYEITLLNRPGRPGWGPVRGDDFLQTVRELLRQCGCTGEDQSLDDYKYP